VKWIKDRTGRFPERPYYEEGEMDFECEQIVIEFLRNKYGKAEFPISTSDITILIERDTSDLDQYADFSAEDGDIQGATDFFMNKKPAVSILEYLSIASQMENRLRTTLTHEYGHVKFHDFLYRRLFQARSLKSFSIKGPRCKRSSILNATKTDWLEWQAGYASGALLMPVSRLKEITHASLREWGLYSNVSTTSDESRKLIERIATAFSVSSEAARVRLSQLGYLSTTSQTIPLFNI
jgi:Zn-dependent peptidase ImmA (M78 family)